MERSRREADSRSPKKTCVESHGVYSPPFEPQTAALAFSNVPTSISDTNRSLGANVAKLLEQNYLILNEIKQNMSLLKVQENAQLLARFRDNLSSMMECMKSMKGVMGQMPTLPAQLNHELADKSLPKTGQLGSGMFPSFMPVPPMGFPLPPVAFPPLPFSGFFPMPMTGLLPGAMPIRVPGMNMMGIPGGMQVNPNFQGMGLVNSFAGMMATCQQLGTTTPQSIAKGGDAVGTVAQQMGSHRLPASNPMVLSMAQQKTNGLHRDVPGTASMQDAQTFPGSSMLIGSKEDTAGDDTVKPCMNFDGNGNREPMGMHESLPTVSHTSEKSPIPLSTGVGQPTD